MRWSERGWTLTTSRETARDALVALLEPALVGTGLPVKTISGSKQTGLEGITPLVTVLSGGSERVALSFQGNQATFSFNIQVWVLQSASGWTHAQSEDALDNIESRIAQVFETNRNNDTWEVLEYGSPTTVSEVAVAGVPYYVESIPTRVRLAKN